MGGRQTEKEEKPQPWRPRWTTGSSSTTGGIGEGADDVGEAA